MSFSFIIEEWIDAPPERVYQVSTDLGLLGKLLAPIIKGGFRKAIRWDVLAMSAFIEGPGGRSGPFE